MDRKKEIDKLVLKKLTSHLQQKACLENKLYGSVASKEIASSS